MLSRFLPGLVLGVVLVTGCSGGPKFAAVSGRITLDGQPLANAFVMFQPVPPAGSAVAAAGGSSGKTDANGEYTLTTSTGEPGAWVGTHRVMIERHGADVSSDARPGRGGPAVVNKIPARYSTETTLTFDVPAGGSTAANFALDSK